MFISAFRSCLISPASRAFILFLSLSAVGGGALAARTIDQSCDKAVALPLGGIFDRQLSPADGPEVLSLAVPTSGVLSVEVTALDSFRAESPQFSILGPDCGRQWATSTDTRWVGAVRGPDTYYLSVTAVQKWGHGPYRLQVGFIAEDASPVGDRLALHYDSKRSVFVPFDKTTEPIDELEDDEVRPPAASLIGDRRFHKTCEPIDELEDDECPPPPPIISVVGDRVHKTTEPIDELEDDEVRPPAASLIGGRHFHKTCEPIDELEDDECPPPPPIISVVGDRFYNSTELADGEKSLSALGGGLFDSVTEPIDELEDDELAPLVPLVGDLFDTVTEPIDELEDDEKSWLPLIDDLLDAVTEPIDELEDDEKSLLLLLGDVLDSVTEPIDELEDDEVIIQIEEDGVLALNAAGADLTAYLATHEASKTHAVMAAGRLVDGGRSLLVPVRAGRYCLGVQAAGETEGTAQVTARLYAFCAAAVSDDHDEGRLCATKVQPGDRVRGTIHGVKAIDRDLFAFTLEAPATVVLETEGDLDTSGVLFAADGTRLSADDDSGRFDNFRIQRTLPSGYYQLRVEGAAAAEGEYVLRVDASAQ